MRPAPVAAAGVAAWLLVWAVATATGATVLHVLSALGFTLLAAVLIGGILREIRHG